MSGYKVSKYYVFYKNVAPGRQCAICNTGDLNDACINFAAQTMMFMVSIN